jgi:hypothetical protein
MALAAVWLAGCAALLGPRTVEVSHAQMQGRIDARFPVERRYLEVIDVSVAKPRLQMRPEVNRIATELDVRLRDRVFGSEHRGTIALNYGLRFEPSDNSVRLTDVRVDRFDVEGLSEKLHQQLDRIGALLAEQTLNNRAIYTLRPKDVEAVQGRGYQPTDIRVRADGLAITLQPAEPR